MPSKTKQRLGVRNMKVAAVIVAQNVIINQPRPMKSETINDVQKGGVTTKNEFINA